MKYKHCSSKYHNSENTHLPITEFGKHPTTADGLQTTCKTCMCEAQRIWRAKHPELKRKQSQQWYKKNQGYISQRKFRDPKTYMLRSIKQSAARRNLDFNLTTEDIEIPELCPVLKIPLYFTVGKRTDNTPSVDRVDSSQGYTRKNIKIISWKANRLKSNATTEELRNLLEYIETAKNYKQNDPLTINTTA
jgi:DNA-binding TFAR19-related protein (PDSD5 family)